jgi:Ser/Thr protein kinase RdoA (MazF antagonist)
MNKNQATKIAQHFNLGNILAIPQKVEGGLCHLMWKIHTDQGHYAVKQLNPTIMSKPDIHAAYELTKHIARQFTQQGIPVATALLQGNKSLITVEDQSFIVYKWVDGSTLDMEVASPEHAKKIASILARIHAVNLSTPELNKPEWDTHSNEHFTELNDKATAACLSFSSNFTTCLDSLLSWNDKYQQAIPSLASNAVVSHGDLDQKNVLWQGNDCILIDWESARAGIYINILI